MENPAQSTRQVTLIQTFGGVDTDEPAVV